MDLCVKCSRKRQSSWKTSGNHLTCMKNMRYCVSNLAWLPSSYAPIVRTNSIIPTPKLFVEMTVNAPRRVTTIPTTNAVHLHNLSVVSRFSDYILTCWNQREAHSFQKMMTKRARFFKIAGKERILSLSTGYSL